MLFLILCLFVISVHPFDGVVSTSSPWLILKLLLYTTPKSLARLNRYVYSNDSGSVISKNTSSPIISWVVMPSYICKLVPRKSIKVEL